MSLTVWLLANPQWGGDVAAIVVIPINVAAVLVPLMMTYGAREARNDPDNRTRMRRLKIALAFTSAALLVVSLVYWFSREEDPHDYLSGVLRVGVLKESYPGWNNVPLTVTEKLRAGRADGTLFGRLEHGGEVRAVCYRRPTHRLSLTVLSPEQTDGLAAHLADLGLPLTGVTAVDGTATAFAEAWRRHAGVAPVHGQPVRLYRLGTLTPPEPVPAGRGRVAEARDRAQVIRWCSEFVAAVGEAPSMDADTWAASRYAEKHYTFRETPDGTPASMAGSTSMIAGMVRVDPVYTPAHLRGRGYASAVAVEVSRAALTAGATDVVLFADPANATSNALYQRIGYVPIADFASYEFSDDAP
ncbi:GNAT family N-acetyltransferase [Actinosynnema sp. NPDC023794]